MSDDLTDFFQGNVIHTYTRAQAIEDGILVDVTKTAAEAGFRAPVAMTRTLWNDCVAWTEADNDRKGTLQDETGRLWDCIWMAINAAARNRNSDRTTVTVYRIPRDGKGLQPRKVQFVLALGAGDTGEAVFTMMFADED